MPQQGGAGATVLYALRHSGLGTLPNRQGLALRRARVVTLTVTVHDDSGQQEDSTVTVADNDYFIVTTGSCYVAHTNAFPKSGTHVLTIKGQHAHLALAPAP